MATLLLITGALPTAQAAFEDRGPVPASTGTGGVHAGDALSFTSRSINPSAGSWRPSWGFHAAWSDPFGIPELSQVRVDACGPLGKSWTTGLWGMGLGSAAYNERSAGLTLSRAFGYTVSAGMGLSWSVVNLDHYGGDDLVSLDAGLTFRHRLIDAGIAVSNLAHGKMERFDESFASRQVTCGVSVPVDEGTRLLVDYLWGANGTGAVRAGMDIHVYGPIQLRAGWDGQTQRLAVGLGIGVGGWSADSAWDHHPYLGWTSSAGIRWEPDHDPLP
ncbi:MAG: hypothetical protein V2A56_10460 [bacterium]